MEVMIVHGEDIQPYSSVEAFRVSVISDDPEAYLFILTPAEFQTLYEIYMGLGEEMGKAVKEKREPLILARWRKTPLLLGIAAAFTSLGLESGKKFGIENGYVMGSLTPHALGKNIYVAFLTRRKDMQRRGQEALEQFQSYSIGEYKGLDS